MSLRTGERWQPGFVHDESFEAFYRNSLEALGLPLERDDALDVPSQLELPTALRAWYSVAGASWLNAAHNRVLAPEHLRHSGGKVVFAEENQDVLVWGFDVGSATADPEVWQRPAGPDDHQWFSEELTLSRFLVEMIRHTVAPDGGSP